MLNLKTLSAALLISGSLLPISLSSPAFAMEEVENFDWSSLAQTSSRKKLPSFEEYDTDGRFHRYSISLERAIKDKEESSSLKMILEDLEQVKEDYCRNNLRAWPIEYIDKYMDVVEKNRKELKKLGIDTSTVPDSL